MAIGLISSGNLKIKGGNINLYAFDDAINAKNFEISGGVVNATAEDLFAPLSDGVCRLVSKAEFMGGQMNIVLLNKNAVSPILYSTNLILQGVKVLGGENKDSLSEKSADYDYIDNFIRIEKEVE